MAETDLRAGQSDAARSSCRSFISSFSQFPFLAISWPADLFLVVLTS